MATKVQLTHDQADALAAWAKEGKRTGGTTAWGPKFSAAMAVACSVLQEIEQDEEGSR